MDPSLPAELLVTDGIQGTIIAFSLYQTVSPPESNG